MGALRPSTGLACSVPTCPLKLEERRRIYVPRRMTGSAQSMKKFTRKIEDFTCGHCGFFVSGNGYTNHCPKCFWSKHVDVNPGDRRNLCQGLMKPIRIESKNGQFAVLHKCQTCKIEKPNKLGELDDLVKLLKAIEI